MSPGLMAKTLDNQAARNLGFLHPLFFPGLLRLVITVRVGYIPRPVGGTVLIFVFFCEKLVADKVIFYPGYLKWEETRQGSAGHVCSRLTPFRERT